MAQIYRAPGVYITENPSPQFAQLPPGARIPAIVGTGIVTQQVKNVAVTKGSSLGSDTIVPLATDTIVSVDAVGTVPDLAEFVATTDYTVSGNVITWVGSEPTTGSTYYVTYRIAKPSTAYKPTRFDTLSDVRSAYGDEIKSGVKSPITIAANLLFANGAPYVIISQSTSANNSDLQTAIDNLKAEDIDIVVMPEATNTTLQNYLRNHVIVESSPSVRHERVMITGFTDGLSPTVSQQTTTATSLKDEKVWVITPPAVTLTFKDTATQQDANILVPSSYAAAAWAGLATNPVYGAAEPFTRKSLVNITNLSTFNYLPSQKDSLASSNITVLEVFGSTIRIRQGLTTDGTTVPKLVPSVIIAKHTFLKKLRAQLDGQFIGTVIDDSTASAIASAIEAFRVNAINDRLIQNLRNVKVTRSTTDPRTVSVTLEAAFLFPLEYIDVNFTLFIS